MASGKTLNQANLAALGAARLADLLLELGADDPAVRRRLRMALAGSAGPAAAAAMVAKRLAGIASARSVLDWRKARALAAELEAQRRAILELVAPGDPREAFELAWRLLGCAGPVHERSDGDSGRLAAVFQGVAGDLGGLALAAGSDPVRLAERAFEAIRGDRHDVCGELVPILSGALGRTGLGALGSLVEAWRAERVPTPPEAARKVVGWSLSGRIYADQLEASHRLSTARFVLKQVADALGDVDGYVAQLDPRARSVPRIAVDIARRLLDAGRARDAWEAVQVTDDRHGPMPLEWEQVRIRTLEALGRADEAQAFRWTCFAETLEASHLRDVMGRLPEFEDFEAEQRGLALASGHRDPHRALSFLVGWPDLARAARLVLDRAGELDGDLYTVLAPAADALQDRHPLAATLLRRAMIDFTLGARHSSRYKHAARHLADCASMAQRIAEPGTLPDHAAYERALRAEHGGKATFWQELRTLSGSASTD